MCHTPVSNVSPWKATPRDSSVARMPAMSSARSGSGHASHAAAAAVIHEPPTANTFGSAR